MAAGKKKPKEKSPDSPAIRRSLRDDAEEQLARSPKPSPGRERQTTDDLSHELQVHQIELEMQAEQLTASHLALEESRDKYLDLYEFAPLAYLTLNYKGRITDVNLTGAMLFGVERDEIINHGLGRFINPGDLETWDRYFAKVRQGGKKQSSTLTLRRGDGSVFPARLEGICTTGSGGDVAIRIAINDITDVWQIEALRESETRFRTIYDRSPIAIELYDAYGALVHANPACLNLFGIDDIYVIKNLSLFADPNISDEQKVKLRDGETVQYQGAFDFEKVKTLNLYPTRRNGTIWLDVLITPLGDRADSITGYLVQIQDITKRQQVEDQLNSANAELTAIDEELRANLDELSRQEQALRTLSAYNRSLLEASVDPLVTINSEGKIADVNLSTEKVTGYSRAELIGNDFSDYFTEPELAKEGYQRVFTEGTVRDYPLGIRHRDGHITPVLYNATVYRDENGKIRGVFAAARDITERRVADEQIKTSEIRYRRLFESAQDGIFILNRDTGEIIDSNPFIEVLTGYSKEELLGKPLWDTGFFKDQIASKIAFEELQTKEYIRYEDLPLETKDGRRIEVEFISNVYPIDPGTSVIQCNIRDITERKVAERELVSVKERLDEAHSIGHIGSWDWVIKTDTVTWSDELYTISGRDPSLPAPTYAEHPHVYTPASWERLSGAVTRALATAEPYNLELELIRPDGSLRWIHAFGGVKRDLNGIIIGLHGTVQDITERRQVQEALRLSNKKLNLLSSITRHDINNQMTGLRGFTTLLERKQTDPSFTEYFQKINAAAGRITAIIQFTKIYESIGINAATWQDMGTLVDAATRDVTLGHVRLENDLPANAKVFADPLIIKVFYNLVENAVRHGKTITTIRFTTEERNGKCLIVCEDDGVGVPADEKEKIFERGFGKNTGLGLFLSREILGITGITIRETGEPGKGTRFEITVPKGAWRMAGDGG